MKKGFLIGIGVILVLIGVPFFWVLYIAGNVGEGLINHSASRSEAKENGFLRYDYSVEPSSIKLSDGSELKFRSAWAEEKWTNRRKPTKVSGNLGYSLHLDFEQKLSEIRPGFSLLDTANQALSNGVGESGVVFSPWELKKNIQILVMQIPKDSCCWKHALVTDTINLTRKDR